MLSSQGTARVVAAIQFVGSISTSTNTWLWSWANTSNLESARTELRKVRKHGEHHGFLKLAAAHWHAFEEDGWEMAAISAFLLCSRSLPITWRPRIHIHGPDRRKVGAIRRTRPRRVASRVASGISRADAVSVAACVG